MAPPPFLGPRAILQPSHPCLGLAQQGSLPPQGLEVKGARVEGVLLGASWGPCPHPGFHCLPPAQLPSPSLSAVPACL